MKIGDLVCCLWEPYTGVVVEIDSQWSKPLYKIFWPHSGLTSKRWGEEICAAEEANEER